MRLTRKIGLQPDLFKRNFFNKIVCGLLQIAILFKIKATPKEINVVINVIQRNNWHEFWLQ